MKFLDSKQKKENVLKKLRRGFLISSSLIVLAVIFSYVLNLLMIGGIFFVFGFAFFQVFMAIFWILNLVVMWKWKRRVYFFFAIILPFLSLIFYIYELYPFLKGEEE